MQARSILTLARVRSCRFEWQKLCNPFTPKSAVQDWQNKAAFIQTKNQEANAIPTKVEPIDWAHWEAELPGSEELKKLRKEYEALKFPETVTLDAASKKALEDIDQSIIAAESASQLAKFELPYATRALEAVQEMKRDCFNWTLKEWHERFPWWEQKHREVKEQGWVIDDDHEKAATFDFKTATKEINAGGNPDMPDQFERLSPVDNDEELGLLVDGRWSIGRVFAPTPQARGELTKQVDGLFAEAQQQKK